MTHGAAFRKPRFHLVSEKDRIQSSSSPPDILKFISHYRSKNISAAYELDSSIPLDDTHAKKAGEDDPVTAKSRPSDTAEKSGRSRQEVSTQDITMLEPHLIAFRKLNAVSGPQEGSASNIPPQLLRLVRFFTFKWVPIKRALLRHPGKNEVGVSFRLSLAREMHEKNLIATAEFQLLEQVIHSNTFIGTNCYDGASRKRERDHMNIVLELKMAFSRIPLDQGNQCSLRHLQATVNDYCYLIRESESDNGEYNDRSDLPSLDQVSDWAIMSFCGIVVSNGIDEPISKESSAYQMELQMVVIMTHENVKNMCFVMEVKKRIQRMLEPTKIDKLSNLNLLCLARFLSYLDASVAWLLFFHSIGACIQGGHGSGFSSLPKLLAAYTTIVSRRDVDFSFSKLENELERLLFRQDHEDKSKKARAARFLKILFESTQYLLSEKEGSEEE